MDSIIKFLLKHPEQSSAIVQTVIYSICAILLLRGFWIMIKGFIYLKRISFKSMGNELLRPVREDDPLELYTAKIFFSAYRENLKNNHAYPRSFIEDAARQIAANSFETNYMVSISNIANLFPPLGFIGTVFGMIFIFIAKSDPNSTLNTLGLGAALFTTLGALICFVLVEGVRILLDRMAVKRIERALKIDVAKVIKKQVKK